MALDKSVEAEIAQAIEERQWELRSQAANDIMTILRMTGVSQVELSLALGGYAPARGQRGRAVVNAWLSFDETPSELNAIVLERLASGRLRLREREKESAYRTLYDVVALPCPKCGSPLQRSDGRRRTGFEKCVDEDCGHEIAPVDSDLVVDPVLVRSLDATWSKMRGRLERRYDLRGSVPLLVQCDEDEVVLWLETKTLKQLPDEFAEDLRQAARRVLDAPPARVTLKRGKPVSPGSR